MNKCIFCDYDRIKEGIVYESDNFYLKVNFGVVSPGHLIIISRYHYSCFGEMPDELDDEYKRLKNQTTEFITKKFHKPFLVEYGAWGQSVEHAHLHFIPLKSNEYEIDSIMDELFIPTGEYFEEANLAKIKQIYKNEGGYISVEENGKIFVYHTNNLPSPAVYKKLSYRPFFVRKGIKAVNDWRTLSEEDKIIDEKKRIITKKAFEKFDSHDK